MILDQQDQHSQQQSPVGTVWARTVHIVEKLFLYGALFIGIHILGGATALVLALLKLAPVPSWVWIELRVCVFLVVPVMGLRLLCVFMTYRSPYNEYYLYILLACVGAFLLDCNLLMSPDLAFPLVSIAYIFQFALDARLPGRTWSMHPLGTMRAESQSRAHSERRPSSSRERVASFRQVKPSERRTPVVPSQKVGIWHCTTDEKFAQLLRTHLQPKIWQGDIELWDASQIQPGALWREERVRAVQSAGVAVVLVSAFFLACEMIARSELPLLLQRAQAQGTVILILHVSPCNITGSGLEKFYPLNSPDRPLARLERCDRDLVMTRAVDVICQRLSL